MNFFQFLRNFFLTKRYLYFLPRKLRLKIFNLKKLKLYKTSTGNYYLPQFAFKDLIRNEIIDNKIFDEKDELGKENNLILNLDIDGFNGPLDLLLQLAQTKKLDITKISILELVDQYLSFIKKGENIVLVIF